MRRVVITGMGIVCPSATTRGGDRLPARSRSGIRALTPATPSTASEAQSRGAPTLDPEGVVDRRAMRFHGGGTAWNHVAMDQAIRDAGLEQGDISNERTGIIMGSGGPSTRVIVEAAAIAREKGPKRIGPVRGAEGDVVHRLGDPGDVVQDPRRELFDLLRLRDVESLHRQRRRDHPGRRQDIIFAGGCEDLDWTSLGAVRRRGAMSSKYNDTPSRASRATMPTATASYRRRRGAFWSSRSWSTLKARAPGSTARLAG